MYVTYDEHWNEDFQQVHGEWSVLEEPPSPTNTGTYLMVPDKAAEIQDRGVAVLYGPGKMQISEMSEVDFLNRKEPHDDDDIFESWAELMDIIANQKEED